MQSVDRLKGWEGGKGGVRRKRSELLIFSHKTRVNAIPMSICYVVRKIDWWVCIEDLSTV